MRNLHDRYGPHALITGASAGLGESFAHALAAQGFELTLTARRADRLERLAATLQNQHHITAHALPADLADHGTPAELFEQTEGQGRPVTLLINNAGFGTYGYTLENALESELAMVDVNCRAVLEMSHRFGNAMKARRRGGIVIVSSIAAEAPLPGMATYAATKSFDLLHSMALHRELKRFGVDVLAVQPGPTTTEFGQVAGYNGPSVTGRTAEDVVRSSLRSLGRSPAVVDALNNRMTATLMRHFPRRWFVPLADKIISRARPTDEQRK